VTWTFGNYLLLRAARRKPAGGEPGDQPGVLAIGPSHRCPADLRPDYRGDDATSCEPEAPAGRLAANLASADSDLDSRVDFDPVTHKLYTTSFTVATPAAHRTQPHVVLELRPYGASHIVADTPLLRHRPKGAPWRLESQIAYDLHQKELLDHRYVFRWRGSCWSARFSITTTDRPIQQRDYRISIDLTGLGTFLDIKGGLDSLSH